MRSNSRRHCQGKAGMQNGRQKEQQLALEWEDLCKRHARPLEKGNGKKVYSAPAVSALLSPPSPYRRETERPPSLGTTNGTATVPLQPGDLAAAKLLLKSRVGQVYNKGGLQYLSEADDAEQRTGSHRRR